MSWDRSTANLLGVRASTNSLGINVSPAMKFNKVYLQPLVSFHKEIVQFVFDFGVLLSN